MMTGELKSKIDSLWEIFWTGGLTNPLDVIEQMTYLMFIHDLDEADNTRAKESAMLGLSYESMFSKEVKIGDRVIDGSQLKWSVFHDFPAGRMYAIMQEWVFPFIKTLHGNRESAYSKYMDDAIFKIPTPLMLDKIVTAMDAIYAQMAQLQATDVRGDLYEYLLGKLATAGVNGQFRTPRHIIRMMVEMMEPKADEIICDPACGTSGFLVAASEYLKEHRKQEVFFNRANKEHYMNHMFHGYDMDRTMLRIGAMNMMTHGVDNPFIEYRDSLSDQNTDRDMYSLILANPPFKGSLDYDIVSTDLLKLCKTKKTELLFLALFLKMLKVGGRCACIVPDGVLFGSSTAHKAIRTELIENNRLEAVISMPSGVFKPYAGVSTAVLIFTKTGHGGTDKVWFYDMQADGFSLDDKRTPIAENDIPDIIERFHSLALALSVSGADSSPRGGAGRCPEEERKRTDRSFLVPKQEIVDNGYDLSINKYKQTEYVAVEYPPTGELLDKLDEEYKQLGEVLADLKGMV
ncbi:MAG: SAM-dependent DNA methyltransferase [Clostridia bacterium]|nr:SAM-dependent DNA methyltransferase [Clostridia bacterium]